MEPDLLSHADTPPSYQQGLNQFVHLTLQTVSQEFVGTGKPFCTDTEGGQALLGKMLRVMEYTLLDSFLRQAVLFLLLARILTCTYQVGRVYS